MKVSRADWLAELRKSGKADTWADACHEWWVVVPQLSIIEDGECPEEWGILTPMGARTRLTVHRQATRKPDGFEPPWWAVRSFMSRIDRVSAERLQAAQDSQKRAQRDREFVEAERARAAETPTCSPEDAVLLKSVKDHLGRAGLSKWRAADLVEYTGTLVLADARDQIRRLAESARLVEREAARVAESLSSRAHEVLE